MTTRIRRFGLGIGAVVMAAAMAAAVQASTQNTAGGRGPFMGRGAGFGHMRMLAGKLGLSDTQKDQIKTILQSHRDEWKTLGTRAAAARRAVNAAVSADTIDENAIRQANAALAAVEGDMAVARAHVRAEVFQVLTPDQQAQAKQLQAQVKQRRGQRFGQSR